MGVKKFPKSTPPEEMMKRRRAWKDGEGGFKVYNREGRAMKIWLDICFVDLDEHVIVPRCPCPRGSPHLHGIDAPARSCYHASVALRRMLREKMGVVA